MTWSWAADGSRPRSTNRRVTAEAIPLPVTRDESHGAGPRPSWRRTCRLVLGEQPSQVHAEGAEFALVAAGADLQDHEQSRGGVVRMDQEGGRLQVIAGLFAQPADDLHATVLVPAVDELLASEVV